VYDFAKQNQERELGVDYNPHLLFLPLMDNYPSMAGIRGLNRVINLYIPCVPYYKNGSY